MSALKKNLIDITKEYLKTPPVKTTPENVQEANDALFHATMNLPNAAKHCGMTEREMKHIFREYLKYIPPTYDDD